MQSLESFRKIYNLSLSRRSERVPIIERYLGISEPADVSVDDHRNEPALYSELAQNSGQLLDECLGWLLFELRAVSYEQSEPVLVGLDFLQSVVSDVSWRYGLHVGVRLENFARDFDRLDTPDERLRLYQMAQSSETFGC